MLSHHYLDHAHLLKKLILKIFGPTVVHRKKYMFTVIKDTNASEYGMIKIPMKSDLI